MKKVLDRATERVNIVVNKDLEIEADEKEVKETTLSGGELRSAVM